MLTKIIKKYSTLFCFLSSKKNGGNGLFKINLVMELLKDLEDTHTLLHIVHEKKTKQIYKMQAFFLKKFKINMVLYFFLINKKKRLVYIPKEVLSILKKIHVFFLETRFFFFKENRNSRKFQDSGVCTEFYSHFKKKYTYYLSWFLGNDTKKIVQIENFQIKQKFKKIKKTYKKYLSPEMYASKFINPNISVFYRVFGNCESKKQKCKRVKNLWIQVITYVISLGLAIKQESSEPSNYRVFIDVPILILNLSKAMLSNKIILDSKTSTKKSVKKAVEILSAVLNQEMNVKIVTRAFKSKGLRVKKITSIDLGVLRGNMLEKQNLMGRYNQNNVDPLGADFSFKRNTNKEQNRFGQIYKNCKIFNTRKGVFNNSETFFSESAFFLFKQHSSQKYWLRFFFLKKIKQYISAGALINEKVQLGDIVENHILWCALVSFRQKPFILNVVKDFRGREYYTGPLSFTNVKINRNIVQFWTTRGAYFKENTKKKMYKNLFFYKNWLFSYLRSLGFLRSSKSIFFNKKLLLQKQQKIVFIFNLSRVFFSTPYYNIEWLYKKIKKHIKPNTLVQYLPIIKIFLFQQKKGKAIFLNSKNSKFSENMVEIDANASSLQMVSAVFKNKTIISLSGFNNNIMSKDPYLAMISLKNIFFFLDQTKQYRDIIGRFPELKQDIVSSIIKLMAHRKIKKNAIMTTVYGAGVHTIAKQNFSLCPSIFEKIFKGKENTQFFPKNYKWKISWLCSKFMHDQVMSFFEFEKRIIDFIVEALKVIVINTEKSIKIPINNSLISVLLSYTTKTKKHILFSVFKDQVSVSKKTFNHVKQKNKKTTKIRVEIPVENNKVNFLKLKRALLANLMHMVDASILNRVKQIIFKKFPDQYGKITMVSIHDSFIVPAELQEELIKAYNISLSELLYSPFLKTYIISLIVALEEIKKNTKDHNVYSIVFSKHQEASNLIYEINQKEIDIHVNSIRFSSFFNLKP